MGVRSALILNLNSSELYTYVGTVSSIGRNLENAKKCIEYSITIEKDGGRMKGKIIEELMDMSTINIENSLQKDEEYRKIQHKVSELRKEINDMLGKKGEELFEEYMENYMYLVSRECKETFQQGVALGVRFTSEAFVLGEDNSSE